MSKFSDSPFVADVVTSRSSSQSRPALPSVRRPANRSSRPSSRSSAKSTWAGTTAPSCSLLCRSVRAHPRTEASRDQEHATCLPAFRRETRRRGLELGARPPERSIYAPPWRDGSTGGACAHRSHESRRHARRGMWLAAGPPAMNEKASDLSRCPSCGDSALRRSRRRAFERLFAVFGLLPFRCETCSWRGLARGELQER